MTAAAGNELTQSEFPLRRALFRLAVLGVLWVTAFRQEWATVFGAAREFSEWTHLYALPVVAIAFLWNRWDDIVATALSTSRWGLPLLAGAGLLWLGSATFGVFAYLQAAAMVPAAMAIVLLTLGGRMLRKLLPLFLMLATCLPLFERSMDRFSISIQSGSVRAAAAAVRLASGENVRPDGNVVVCSRAGLSQRIGEGEQRFGFRAMPACVMLAVYLVFSKPRSGGFLAAMAVVAIPILLAANVFRVIVWIAVQWAGGFGLTDVLPRNVSAVGALLVTFVAFYALGVFFDRFSSESDKLQDSDFDVASAE